MVIGSKYFDRIFVSDAVPVCSSNTIGYQLCLLSKKRGDHAKRKQSGRSCSLSKKVDTNTHKYIYTMEFFRYIRNKLVVQAFRHNAITPAAKKVGLGNNKNTRIWSELAKTRRFFFCLGSVFVSATLPHNRPWIEHPKQKRQINKRHQFEDKREWEKSIKKKHKSV